MIEDTKIMLKAEMIKKLVDLGYPSLESKDALVLTDFNFDEAKELLAFFFNSSYMSIVYEVLKLKRLEKSKEQTETVKIVIDDPNFSYSDVIQQLEQLAEFDLTDKQKKKVKKWIEKNNERKKRVNLENLKNN